VGCIPPTLAELLDGVRKEFDADRATAKALLNGALSLLRVEAERQASTGARHLTTGGLAAWQIRRLNVYVETRLDQRISLKELSAVSKLSSEHFSRALKRTFGETPHSLVVRRRLERAETLVLTSDLPLNEIALRTQLPGSSLQTHSETVRQNACSMTA
jgi:AraC family transcriptional regulator